MPLRSLRAVLKRVRRLVPPAKAGGVTDAALLERFARGDEAAFELLVWRHGPMVLGACRRVLRHEQDAEDAFQATFLALARRAAAIRKSQSLGGWLYTVAHRVALRAREDRDARPYIAELTGKEPAADPRPGPAEELARREVGPLLESEVARLPEKYRAAFVLCYLEGKTNEEAAELLGCPKGTVLSRLARARERLRRRLAGRHLARDDLDVAAVLVGHGRDLPDPSSALVAGAARLAWWVAAGTSFTGAGPRRHLAPEPGPAGDSILPL
jgi:RNA polymerase sigma factor (sigma-70 family)